MVKWTLVDWRPDNINRGNSPDVWDNIYKNGVIPEGLKKQLLREHPTLLGKTVEFGIYFSREGYAELAAYADGMAYTNAGVQWSYTGAERLDKRDRGSRMKFFPAEKDFGREYANDAASPKPSLQEQMAGAAAKAGQTSNRGEKTGLDGPGGR